MSTTIGIHVTDSTEFKVFSVNGHQWLRIGDDVNVFMDDEQMAKLDECLRYWLLDKQLEQASCAIVDNVE